MVRRLVAFTDLPGDQVSNLEGWCRTDLVNGIDEAILNPYYTQEELSELLANAGILPMFGFPTRVRPLYGRWVGRREELDGRVVTDRALDMAISAFAPGSQVVREGVLHTAVGFAAYEIKGPKALPRDPLGPPIPLRRCQECGTADVSVEGPEVCRVCGSATESIPLHQPLGFRTDYRNLDFDDRNEPVSSAGAPQLAVNPEGLALPEVVGAMTVRVLDQAEVVQVNDNRGRLFSLLRLSDRSVVCDDESLYEDGLQLRMDTGTRLDSIAIGDVRPTDVLVVSLDQLSLQGRVIPTSRKLLPAGLSAMWSFAEVLRRGCQVALDIEPHELQVGLQPARISEVRTHRVFLADSLENGAGYAPELGRSENLNQVLKDILGDLANRYEDDDHGICTESCPDCLRSYDNRWLHGALDWRLALDVASLAAGLPLKLERWLGRVESLASGFVKAYEAAIPCEVFELESGLQAIVRKDRERAAILGHPLWRREEAYLNEVQAEAYDEVTSELGVGSAVITDAWVLQRLPAQLYQRLAHGD
ncbi:MAG: DUF1998 domain-containing protein [Actinomycetota bacterium]